VGKALPERREKGRRGNVDRRARLEKGVLGSSEIDAGKQLGGKMVLAFFGEAGKKKRLSFLSQATKKRIKKTCRQRQSGGEFREKEGKKTHFPGEHGGLAGRRSHEGRARGVGSITQERVKGTGAWVGKPNAEAGWRHSTLRRALTRWSPSVKIPETPKAGKVLHYSLPKRGKQQKN